MIIKLNDLVFEGIHGLTEKEKKTKQKFKIDISIESWSTSKKDDINKTIDYRKIKKIVQEIIENESFDLIETIAHRIADHIVSDTRVLSAKVTVGKPDIWENGLPSVRAVRYAHYNSDVLDFDVQDVIKNLMYVGAVSVPILSEEKRKILLKEAESYEYVRQPEIVGPAKVREELSSCVEFSKESLFYTLKDSFTEVLNYKLSFSRFKPNVTNFIFNEMSLQKYDRGSIGITPHKDNLSCIHCIAIFILKGKSTFAICSDRSGSHPEYIDTTPGNVILLRAPGFFGSDFRPFHFVTNIIEERIVFGLRHNVKK